MLGLIVLSWCLLLWQLANRSLWVDEFFSRQMIQGTPADVVNTAMADLHPPLYFLALQAWVGVAGSSDFSLRWLSVAAGVVGVALVPAVARRLVDPRVGVVAAFLLAVAPAFIEFSRMARYYSLTLTLGLLSTKLLLDAIDRGAWRRWLAYGVTGAALLYTFYPAGVLLVAHGLIIIWPKRQPRPTRRWLTTALAIGLSFAPWFIAVAARQITGVSGSAGADLARSGLGFGLGLAASMYTFSVGETLFPWRPEAWTGLIVVALLVGLGLRKSSAPGAGRSAGLFLVCIVFMSIVTTFVSVGTPFLNVPVRGLFVLPYYLMIAAAGLTRLTSTRHMLVLGGALLAVWGVSLVNDFSGQQFLNPIYLTPSKEAAGFVRSHAADADLVISEYDSVFGYYFLTGAPLPPHRYADRAGDVQAALQLSPPHVWLITLGRDQTQRDSPAAGVRQALADGGYRLEQTERLLPIDPFYLRVKNFILRRETYDYRLTIETYRHNLEP